MRRTTRHEAPEFSRTSSAVEEFPHPRKTWPTRSSKSDVASLFADSIPKMDREELLEVIQASQLPWIDQAAVRRLELADRPTLVRIAQIVRHSCRRQGY